MSDRAWGPAMRRWVEDGPQHGIEFHLAKIRRGASGSQGQMQLNARATDDLILRMTDESVLRITN